jgi:hypothetical protein
MRSQGRQWGSNKRLDDHTEKSTLRAFHPCYWKVEMLGSMQGSLNDVAAEQIDHEPHSDHSA